MKIRIYQWDTYYDYNIFYKFTHPKEPGYEHRNGVTKIELEDDNKQVYSVKPLARQLFGSTSVNVIVFKCKNCQTQHIMINEGLHPIQVHFTSPCKCGNISTNMFRSDGCLIRYQTLPVFEIITDYKHNSRQTIKVEKLMNESTYNNFVKELLK